MSNLFVRRRAEHSKLLRPPVQPRHKDLQATHPFRPHLTLVKHAGLNIDVERATQILAEAPESTSEALTVRAARAIIVGQKAVSCSVALEIHDPTETLVTEHDYFQTIPETQASRYHFFGHITLASGLAYPKAQRLTERLNRKLPEDDIQLHPVSILIGSDDTASKQSPLTYSTRN